MHIWFLFKTTAFLVGKVFSFDESKPTASLMDRRDVTLIVRRDIFIVMSVIIAFATLPPLLERFFYYDECDRSLCPNASPVGEVFVYDECDYSLCPRCTGVKLWSNT